MQSCHETKSAWHQIAPGRNEKNHFALWETPGRSWADPQAQNLTSPQKTWCCSRDRSSWGLKLVFGTWGLKIVFGKLEAQ
mmetsp:Transcript_29751/g.52299  ORF Transcript_29751/g.52299 Transcript_29751/m.52299 type:complete len:80 (+) Transcript_29751:40-279(+)